NNFTIQSKNGQRTTNRGGGCNGRGRSDHAQNSRAAQVPDSRAARVCVGAIGGQDRDVRGRVDNGGAARRRLVQGNRHRAVLGGRGAVARVRTDRGQGGRDRRGQVERISNGPRRSSGGARDQRRRGAQSQGNRLVSELHDDRHRDAAEADP